MPDKEFNANGKVWIAEGLVCIPLQRFDDLAQTERGYRTAVRGIQRMVERGYAGVEDARMLLDLLGEIIPERVPEKQEGRERKEHAKKEELPYT